VFFRIISLSVSPQKAQFGPVSVLLLN